MEQSAILAALAISGNARAVQVRGCRIANRVKAEREVTRLKQIKRLRSHLKFLAKAKGVDPTELAKAVSLCTRKLNDLLPLIPKLDRSCARKVGREARYASSIKASIRRFKEAERRAVEA